MFDHNCILRPMMAIPPDWRRLNIGERILPGDRYWNGSDWAETSLKNSVAWFSTYIRAKSATCPCGCSTTWFDRSISVWTDKDGVQQEDGPHYRCDNCGSVRP